MLTTDRIEQIATVVACPCPLCGEIHPEFLHFTDSEMGYYRCEGCGICYTETSNLNQLTTEAKDMRKGYSFPDGSNPHIKFGINHYLPKIRNIRGLLKGSFLDIGFANQTVLDIAKMEGYDTTGIDINTMPSDLTSKHQICHGDFEKLPVTDKMFDVVWASHVFEHFIDPIAALQKCYNIMNYGGVIYISMPDLWFVDRFSEINGWGHWKPTEHHTLWEKDRWVERMVQAGFTIKSAVRNNDHRFSAWHDFQVLGVKE